MATGIGARRRLQALAHRGWSGAAIERAGLGISATEADLVLQGRPGVTQELADRIAAAYELLWDRRPAQTTASQRAEASAQQARAERAGWPPPLAGDEDGEIDDPNAGPAPGWRRSGRQTIPSAELVEDAEFVRRHGGCRSLKERAMRLGVSRDRLEHAYARAGRRQAAGTEREAG